MPSMIVRDAMHGRSPVEISLFAGRLPAPRHRRLQNKFAAAASAKPLDQLEISLFFVMTT
jgi:hypothetical protein